MASTQEQSPETEDNEHTLGMNIPRGRSITNHMLFAEISQENGAWYSFSQVLLS